MIRRLVFLWFFVALPLSAATFKADDGTSLHYDTLGKGRTVVMLSGGPGFSPTYMQNVAERLSQRYQVVMFHQRGTGRSSMEKITFETHALKTLVADLEALRRDLKVEKFTLLGHSFGGILSMLYASEHPDRLEALVLVDSGGPTLATVAKFISNLNARFTPEDLAKVKEWSDPAKMKEDHRKAILEITRAKTPAYFADREKGKVFADGLDELAFNDAVFYAITPQLMAGLDLREPLKKVTAPVLVIHGKQDPLESADEVHATFPKSELVMIDNAGHFPWVEQPDVFYKALGPWLLKVIKP